MKKVISMAFMATSLCAQPYVGIKAGLSLQKNNVSIKATDFIKNTAKMDVDNQPRTVKNKPLSFGVLAGWQFNNFGVFTPFIEADYSYANKKRSTQTIDMYEDFLGSKNMLRNENIDVIARHSLGIMPGVYIPVINNLSALVGVRFNVSQYSVKAYHVTPVKGVLPDNTKSNKMWFVAFEPTIGAKYAFSDKVSGRFTVGYNVSQRKNVVKNYLNQPAIIATGAKAGVSLRPSALTFGFSVLYNYN